ncbi:MAG TPA: hypothetical protein VKX28_23885 [Xanthobacteraceae bacterium]|nr:hypothetical protein [Xanthobacteraceae bacterium]
MPAGIVGRDLDTANDRKRVGRRDDSEQADGELADFMSGAM